MEDLDSSAPPPAGAPVAEPSSTQQCDVCGKRFALEFPYQLLATKSGQQFFCSLPCRKSLREQRSKERHEKRRPWRLAVFNHKGGTGKTTTAVNIAAGMAEAGKRVLLVDADGQGNVGVSLGINGAETLYHVLVSNACPEEVAVPVRPNFDVLTSNETLAAVELFLASKARRDRRMRECLGNRDHGYDVVVIDCAPALSLMNQNALVYADGVLIPIGCDYLSIVGMQQVMRTIGNVRELLRHPIQLWGVLPTFYDQRNRISRESRAALQRNFGDRCLPPVRVNTKLREAPSARKTIFEYAAESHGAEDYRRVVEELLRSQQPQPDAATQSVATTQPAMPQQQRESRNTDLHDSVPPSTKPSSNMVLGASAAVGPNTVPQTGSADSEEDLINIEIHHEWSTGTGSPQHGTENRLGA